MANKADISPDTPMVDRGEQVSYMDPLVLAEHSRHRSRLLDLALELAQKSTGFVRSLPPPLIPALAALVRSMNCYYSNLIEGHNTHPIDIERALNSDYSSDSGQRDLQLEARAHIAVQTGIDSSALQSAQYTTREVLADIHRRFCELLPDELLWVDDPVTHERLRVHGGELRTRDVMVGTHVAVSPGALPRFLRRFEEQFASLGKTDLLVATAAAHHRFLWMHPFLDGNGRVARLMSHGMLLSALDTGSLWSVSRGLARNAQEYKVLLSRCDQTRRNDLDGRGTLSEEALADFTAFFLTICIDQVTFMESLAQPDRLRNRILQWAAEEIQAGTLPTRAADVLSAVLYRGEISRGEVDTILGTGSRQARRITACLQDRGALTSDSPRAPLRLAFPATLAGRWMPGLFPEHP